MSSEPLFEEPATTGFCAASAALRLGGKVQNEAAVRLSRVPSCDESPDVDVVPDGLGMDGEFDRLDGTAT